MTRAARSLRGAVDRTLTDRMILLLGWLWFLVYAFPGYMSADSVYQLSQARLNEPLNDWHPPMMALIWRYLDMLIAGPLLMLVLQSVTFLIGLYVLLSHVMSKRAAAITAVVVLLAPQNIHVMAVIWKDSQMAGFLIAAVAALLSDSRRWRVVGYLLIFVATAVRYNAAAPTFPIILVLFDRHGTLHWFKRYAAACALWIAITASAFVVSSLIVDTKVYPWHTGAAPVDIYGVLHFAKGVDTNELEREFPNAPWAHPGKTRALADASYMAHHTFFHALEGDNAIFNYPETPEHRAGIAGVWKKLVFENPGAFLEHRLGVFILQLRGRIHVWDAFVNADWGGEKVRHRATHSTVQQWWVDNVRDLVVKRVFKPKFYFVLMLVFLLFCRRQRLAFALLASGLAHEVGLFLLAPAADYRYSHWMVVSTMIAGIILFVRRRQMSDPQANAV